jgi:hypothetical protein
MIDDTRPPHVAFVVNSAFIDHHETAPSESGRNSASNLASWHHFRKLVIRSRCTHLKFQTEAKRRSQSPIGGPVGPRPNSSARRRWRTHPYPLAFLPSPSWHNKKSALVKPPIKAWASLRFWHSDHALGMHSARPRIALCVNHCCVETEQIQMFQVSGFYNDTRWTSYLKALAWPERNTAQHSHDIMQPRCQPCSHRLNIRLSWVIGMQGNESV